MLLVMGTGLSCIQPSVTLCLQVTELVFMVIFPCKIGDQDVNRLHALSDLFYLKVPTLPVFIYMELHINRTEV